jgi:hypothetical protein
LPRSIMPRGMMAFKKVIGSRKQNELYSLRFKI